MLLEIGGFGREGQKQPSHLRVVLRASLMNLGVLIVVFESLYPPKGQGEAILVASTSAAVAM